jgi:membrane-associated protein
VLAAAILGGMLGDGLSFWTGHKLQHRILERWPLSAYPKLVRQAEEFFRRRGTLAVFFARFVAPVRAFVPIVAGALTMPPRRFFAVNIPAVAAWAAAHVVTSAFAGHLLERATFGAWRETLEPYAIPAIAVLTLIAFAVWTIRHWHLCGRDLAEALHLPHHLVNHVENHIPHRSQAEAARDQPREIDLR